MSSLQHVKNSDIDLTTAEQRHERYAQVTDILCSHPYTDLVPKLGKHTGQNLRAFARTRNAHPCIVQSAAQVVLFKDDRAVASRLHVRPALGKHAEHSAYFGAQNWKSIGSRRN